MERVFAAIGITVSIWFGGGLVFVGLCRAIDKLQKLRYKRKLLIDVSCLEKGFELELGRHYLIQLDDGEDIWELKAKAVKQKRRERTGMINYV